MRSTRRRLEGIAAFAGVAMAMSCSTVTRSAIDDVEETPRDAAAPNTAAPDAPDAPDSPTDGGVGDGQAYVRRKVECASKPCAVALSKPSAGEAFCALVDGRVACWGANNVGELGRGEDAGFEPSGQPMFVEGLEAVTSLGGSCVILADGVVKCWGAGRFFRETGAYRTPAPVTLPTPPAKRIFADGDRSICALLVTGEVLCAGEGIYGLRPDGTNGRIAPTEPTIVPLPPGAPVVDVAAGSSRFALREDGTALSWGSWTSIGRASSLPLDPDPLPVELDRVTNLDVAGGDVCAVANDRLYCWGQPEHYDGQNPFDPKAEPIPTPDLVVEVSISRRQLHTRPRRGCAVGRAGDVYCWGPNDYGQVGDGTRSFAVLPVKVIGLSAPAVSVRASVNSTCALLENGSIECWGSNTSGALGRGEFGSFELSPAPVKLP